MTTLVLAGNGGYANRGCEAIEAGTLRILRHAVGEARFVIAPFGEEPQGIDCGVDCTRVQRRFYGSTRFTPQWAYKNLLLRVAPRKAGWKLFTYDHLDADLRSASALLQLGGDNLSMDYGGPEPFFALDDFALTRGCPVVVWGASVGPFDSDPEYEKWATGELARTSLILARETRTFEYLHKLGLAEKTELVADPAFALLPSDPAERGVEIVMPEQAIGFNVSPLYARFAGGQSAWVERCADVAKAISEVSGKPLVLVPHVIVPTENDHALLAEVRELLRVRDGIESLLLPAELSAAELKWAIGRLSLFVGARTHATIAALSQAVPTVSLAYSVKAYGLNVDLLGSDRYIVDASEFGPESVSETVKRVLEEEGAIRERLSRSREEFTARAFRAGDLLVERVLSA